MIATLISQNSEATAVQRDLTASQCRRGNRALHSSRPARVARRSGRLPTWRYDNDKSTCSDSTSGVSRCRAYDTVEQARRRASFNANGNCNSATRNGILVAVAVSHPWTSCLGDVSTPRRLSDSINAGPKGTSQKCDPRFKPTEM